MTILELDAIDRYFATHHNRDAFRWECLDRYTVDSDDDDFVRYLRGEPHPDAHGKNDWLDQLRSDTTAGRCWRRVHVLRTPLSDYLRYECEWGYVYNVAAGEEVRILDLSERIFPGPVMDHDFWLLDDQHALRMHYDGDGHFLGASVADTHTVDSYRAARDSAWTAAEPFTSWWRHHPEYHRDN